MIPLEQEREAKPPPRLLYVVTEDWYFLSHRLPMARAARGAGFEVHVATRVVDGAAAIAAEGFVLHPVPFARGRLSPPGTLATIRALRRIHRTVAPAIAHHVAVQASVLGSLAAWGRPVRCINAVTGLGYTFTSGSARAALLRPIVSALLRLLLNRPGQTVLVQNPDDRANMLALGIAAERIALIPGSGVDVEALQPLPEPQGPPAVAFAGRLLADKGIHTLIRAHRLLRERGSPVELLIAGTPDPANPASVSEQEAAGWGREPGIAWLGHVDPIVTLWGRAHIAVLPSRREGLPKSLLEAAACGRPMIAADVPGCREVVRPGETGLLVPLDDAAALAGAIETLAGSRELRARYGAAARRLAVERFSAAAIGRQTVDLYRQLVE
jgi:glycosyltransferase involved in cell wall biosynthesis